MQNDINHYVTRDRTNNASFKQKLDAIGKNVLRRQNPLELVSEDISTFDAENPIIDSLLRELDVKKKDITSDTLNKSAPAPPGTYYEIQNRLNRLKDRQEPPPSPPFFPPSPPATFIPPSAAPFQPPPSIFDLFQPQAPRTDNNFQTPPSIFDSFQPLTPRTDKNFGNFHVPAQLSSFNKTSAKGPSNNLFGSQAATLTTENEQEKVVQDSVRIA